MLELLPMPERGVKFPADELPKEKPAEEVPIVPSRLLRPPPPQMGSPLSESSESRAPQSAKENDDFDPFAPIGGGGATVSFCVRRNEVREKEASRRARTRTRSSAKKRAGGGRETQSAEERRGAGLGKKAVERQRERAGERPNPAP